MAHQKVTIGGKDGRLARALVSEGNNGAAIRGEQYRYIAVPDLDAVDTASQS